MTNQAESRSVNFKQKVKRNVADNFDRSYQKYQVFEERHHFFYTLALKLAESIGLQPETAVLDVGCGSGISARALHDRFGCRVLGVDLSEKMVAVGQELCPEPDLCLRVGDGERLIDLSAGRKFDYVLYNAAIFIFPDVDRTFQEAFACLQPGGKIAFSFYPELVGPKGEDLLHEAFARLGEPEPRYKVITSYDQASQALACYCADISHYRWVRPLDLAFLKDFYAIPAQSASLFPGKNYETRLQKATALFETLEDLTGSGRIVWQMASGVKRT